QDPQQNVHRGLLSRVQETYAPIWGLECTRDATKFLCRTYRSLSRHAVTTRVTPNAVNPISGTVRTPGTNASSIGRVRAALKVSTPRTLHTTKNAAQSTRRIREPPQGIGQDGQTSASYATPER